MTSQPPTPEEPGPERPAAAKRSRAHLRALGVALLCGAAGATLALVSAGQVWNEGVASFAQGRLPVEAKGSEVTGLPSALALVGLAALVAVFAVRRTARTVVAVLLTLCGLGTGVSALLSARDSTALDERAAEASALTEGSVGALDVTVWPYVSVLAGLLLLTAGLLALRYGASWPSMSGSARYERRGADSRRRRPVDPERPEEMWRALDRGEDPT
ncbi:TIGR02234 family membrane protein [Streptomyces sp. NPDC005438]|uniref:TIGR02234 family membrane protein n=1 Tax=Streptomyces sp. NPDC005438 TaxID=3156880 RepID=UPI00339F19C3